jgi:uncharacterized protein YceH (UPF0502 family)
MPPNLSPLEARIVGVLVEKQRAVPDTYPLSLNALVAGCNQKTSRDPIMEVGESEVQAALDELRRASLVVESSGGRVMRYAHNLDRALGVPGPAVVLLAVMMLRGPQTAGELRINTDRLHRFADISAVEGYLHELAARADGALVEELPRAPGARETRWTHLLSGPPAQVADGTTTLVQHNDLMAEAAALTERLAQMEAELADLRRTVGDLRRRLEKTGSV